jgi:hypothetical protein
MAKYESKRWGFDADGPALVRVEEKTEDVTALVAAAQAARDTLDSLRRGAKFSRPAYEAGYAKLREALLPFAEEGTDNDEQIQ